MPIKVLVNGFGTIGKRVSWAIQKQEDMKLIGIVKRSPDFKALAAVHHEIPIYVDSEDTVKIFEEYGITVKGTINEALHEADIVVDAGPGGKGELNKPIYENRSVKAIFQGGEKDTVAEVSFVAQVNYNNAVNRNFIRVVSCNTTGLARIIHSLSQLARIRYVRGTLIRRAADPWETKKGPINAIVPSFKIPSHHAYDVQTVLGKLDILTIASIVPTTLMHLHILNIKFEESLDRDDIINHLQDSPRILVFPSALKFDSTASIIEFARDLGRPRGDLYEVAVFDDSVKVFEDELWISYAVHQEAIVVPENIDAIRAAFGLADANKSIELTDKSLGILRRV